MSRVRGVAPTTSEATRIAAARKAHSDREIIARAHVSAPSFYKFAAGAPVIPPVAAAILRAVDELVGTEAA